MNKKLIDLSNEIADYLGVESLSIKFEDIGEEDSRLYTKDEYIAINNKYDDNYFECARCIAHEYRHVFQIYYANYFDTDIALRWRILLASNKNSSEINSIEEYLEQELEIDAFAFTKFYLEHFKNIRIVNRIDGLDKILDMYIEKNKAIM